MCMHYTKSKTKQLLTLLKPHILVPSVIPLRMDMHGKSLSLCCSASLTKLRCKSLNDSSSFFWIGASSQTIKTTKHGVVHASVGQKVMPLTSSQGYLCTIFYIRWAREITSPSTTTQTNNKHHHHGDGAPCPSSGMESMNLCRPSGRRPCVYIVQGSRRRILLNSIN